MKVTDFLIAVAIFVIILLIIVPLSPVILDFMLIVSVTLSVMVLMMALFTKETLDFSVFPSLLLIMTLFRLALNISSTRLILGNSGEAGAVIRTFGSFVIGSNITVGVIIYAIIIVIQFIVITKGAERVAEVAARFTLDAMPGKQMAIDADLNAGLINEQQARQRRQKIQREADFYGSMDGASKFVKGDAIVGILITVINMLGGIAIGVLSSGMAIDEVVSQYTLATVGDGLVSQLPALLVSTATGIIVTRAASENNLGRDITDQFSAQPVIMILAAVMIFLLGMIPGLPKVPIVLLSAVLLVLGLMLRRQKKAAGQIRQVASETQARKKPENVTDLLQIDPIELEFGYGLVGLADASQGGELSERITMIRRQSAIEQGLIIPGIRLRDNVALKNGEYRMKIRGEEVARGDVVPDGLMALHAELDEHPIQGTPTTDPSFGLPALWIKKSDREQAELHGYTIIDPPSVIATHLSEVIKRHGHELLDRQQVQSLVDHLKKTQPALVEEIFPQVFSLGDLQKVLAGLLKESISIRDIGTIAETMADNSQVKHPDQLVELVRQRLRRSITRRHTDGGRVDVITLDPALEQLIAERIRQSEQGSFVAISPDQIQQVLQSLKREVEQILAVGKSPIIMCSPHIRPHFKKMSQQLIPDLVVLSYNEIESDIEICAQNMVSIGS